MIQKMSHVTIYVLDLDEARSFYTDKLGFVVRMDQTMGDFRWLTVSPSDQELELVLMQPGPGMSPETAAQVRDLIARGAMGAGVFQTDDCQRAYAELSARGVEFIEPPAERPYGIEATFRDNSGNWFSLTQPR